MESPQRDVESKPTRVGPHQDHVIMRNEIATTLETGIVMTDQESVTEAHETLVVETTVQETAIRDREHASSLTEMIVDQVVQVWPAN